ncbi:unnamed protein product [Rotaria sordida]|uniref:Uncharacterized protein n=1 Tax=Rotaria sordida TaxID=392033 RepID=A0A815MUQ6_9BILA|nr:unnamed protein product [Rotaria sordida]CAF1423172.1 unnamed protein product [Rotaria sordida]CAF4025197.1 unnamed protein product [Rotaria sordida]CAF4063744.1 unnamed protein product [Rotaria sordida]
MNERNTSTRSYTLNRRAVERSEVYHVVIFPCDNSFSVVKSKQCSPAEQDGFVFVQSGHKKYMGFIFETGNFEICSKAADRLVQKQHEDIESDYERRNENTQSKDITSNTSEKPTYITLKDVPFSIDVPVNFIHNDSPRQTVSNLNMINGMTPTRAKNGSGSTIINKGWQRTRHESCPKVSIALDEPGADSNDDVNFPSSLIFTSTDGMSSTDLMKIPATRDKANLYVTNLVEILYTMDELVALKPEETHNDYRYQLIRESVRCKFKLTNDQLDQLFNDWLREVFLAKRRVAVRKLKMSMNNE